VTDVDPALSLVRLIERGADVSLDPLPASVTVVRRADGDPGDRLASLLEAASSVVAVVPQLDTTLLAVQSTGMSTTGRCLWGFYSPMTAPRSVRLMTDDSQRSPSLTTSECARGSPPRADAHSLRPSRFSNRRSCIERVTSG